MRGMNVVGLSLASLVGFTLCAFSQTAPVPVKKSTISTVAGNGVPGFSGDGGPAISAQLQGPGSLAMDVAGNLYVTDAKNSKVRKITPEGTILSINAGTVGAMDMMILDPSGAIYMTSVATHSVRKVDANGASVVVAGSGASGFSGDDGPATAAKLNSPFGLAVDSSGNLFVADSMNHRIRKVTPAGIISTIAGTGKPGFGGDRGKAASAQLNFPASLALDPAGNLYFSDVGNSRVRRITPAGTIETVAGNGKAGFSGDGGKATSAQLGSPGPLAFDSEGNLYIVDALNHRIRKVNSSGIIATVAGNGEGGAAGDGGPAEAAQLTIPAGLVVGPVGNLFVADERENRIRKITFNR